MHDIETSLSLIPGQARFADVAVQLRKGRGREGERERGREGERGRGREGGREGGRGRR